MYNKLLLNTLYRANTSQIEKTTSNVNYLSIFDIIYRNAQEQNLYCTVLLSKLHLNGLSTLSKI